MKRRRMLQGLAALPWSATACGRKDGTALRFSGIPDGDKSALKEGYAAVSAYLSKAMDIPVQATPVPDYTAAVTALANGGIDFAWLGGVTTVQAEQRTPDGVHFVAARASDLHFKSYIIGNAAVAESLGLQPLTSRAPGSLASLAALATSLRGRRFSFGSKSSTSGHVMPRAFFSDPAVGLDPESDFAGGPVYQAQGGHAATLRAVASRAVDFGVLNFASWEQADPALQAQAPVLGVTPEFVDYCLVARGSMPKAQAEALADAFLALDASNEGHAPVLAAFAAERFVRVTPSSWDGIRDVLASLQDAGALK
ncbi:MAG: PhnD/SsuA/transferrin family substrate-binding protein [Nannocystaceae bacterium]|nr:PhnD/SsuA/transferrin family substrate-binding protein [bacterium]